VVNFTLQLTSLLVEVVAVHKEKRVNEQSSYMNKKSVSIENPNALSRPQPVHWRTYGDVLVLRKARAIE